MSSHPLQPRVFLSYARDDAALAKSVRDAVAARGFRVFFDETSMRAGEDFVHRLTGEIARADAVVALLTPASVTSEWCVAEWYWAHARGVPVVPIRFGPIADVLPAPIRLLEDRIHFLQPADVSDYDRVAADLARQLDEVRRARVRRTIVIAAAVVVAMALAAAGAYAVYRRIDSYQHGRARSALLDKILRATQPIAGQEIEREAAAFGDDPQLRSSSLDIANDAYRPHAARLNAVMLSSDLLRQRKPEKRWFVRDAVWRNGVLDGAKLTDVTFYSGSVEHLNAANSTFAAVYWGGPPRFTLGSSTFRGVQFAGGGFDRTNAIGVDFIDCVFRGAEIDVTNFGLVTFRSSPPDPAHPTLVTPNVAAFENCVILNRQPPPAPNVRDLGDPAEEVRFRDVVFTGVRFRGNVHLEWFENCSFDRCTFPKAIDLGQLERRSRTVAECSVADESLD